MSGARSAATRRTIHLIRHADALGRRGWEHADEGRPLSARGVAQARALAERYRHERPSSLLSSPAVRCIQTLEPIACGVGRTIERVEFLVEGTSGSEAHAGLLDSLAGSTSEADPFLLAACTHGDVLEELLRLLAAGSTELLGPRRAAKSGTFELAVDGGVVRSARYLAPPDLRAAPQA